MIILGIGLGLCAATLQSGSYLCSKYFSNRHPKCEFKLFVFSHVIMGVISLPILIISFPRVLPPIQQWIYPMLMINLCYCFGQYFLIKILNETEASKISPLLILKVPLIVLFTILFYDGHYRPGQWVAIGLTLIAAFMLNKISHSISIKSFIFLLLTITGYCWSDINIKITMNLLSSIPLIQRQFFVASFSYVFTATLMIPLFWFTKTGTIKQWKDSIPFAVFWLGAMIFLFGSIAQIGAVYANIIQSSRGLFSIILASIIVKMGYHHYETKHSLTVTLKRIFVACLLILATLGFHIW